ncbi:MAG: hypothetical protein FI734_07065 [SAR202 cluster bacterium]|nr:hypothetical protein [SAR202 cluster bacterium]
MSINFEMGNSQSPKGHAILYFGSLASGFSATYVVLLPIKMDMSKYLPPLMTAQLGSEANDLLMGGTDVFAVPPVPEEVTSEEYLKYLAEIRGDDLVWGGEINLAHPQVAMQSTSEAVQEYNALFRSFLATRSEPLDSNNSLEGALSEDSVQGVLYEFMNERDRLAEMSKLVGTMRFALESNDLSLIKETDASLGILTNTFDESFWGGRIRLAAQDPSELASKLVQMYVERCYFLLDNNFTGLEEIEKQISLMGGDLPPNQDMRA